MRRGGAGGDEKDRSGGSWVVEGGCVWGDVVGVEK